VTTSGLAQRLHREGELVADLVERTVPRTADTRRSIIAGIAFGALVVLAVAALLLSLFRTGPATPLWALALVVGTLVALVALLLLEPLQDPQVAIHATSTCAACGKPTLEEWRLCPYCGLILECELPLPMREERVSG